MAYTPFNTGNPIGTWGSVDPRDLVDNAAILDRWVNDRTITQWRDRFGVQRMTWNGMEVAFRQAQDDRQNAFDEEQDEHQAAFDAAQAQREADFNAFLLASGYQFVGDYDADGPLTITQVNQIFSKDGEFWRAGPTLAGQLPYTTANNWTTDLPKMVAVGDAAIRQQLANSSDLTLGANLVSRATPQIASLAALRSVHARYAGDCVYLVQYSGSDGLGSGVFRWDASSTSAEDGGTVVQVTGVTTGRWIRDVPNYELFAEMFGAKGDSTTDDTAAIQSMLTAATITGRNANLSGKSYLITSSLVLRTYPITMASSFTFRGLPDFKGINANKSRLVYPGLVGAPALIVENVDGQFYSPLKAEVGSRITFEGSSTSWGIEYRGTGQLNTSEAVFSTNRYGQVFHNKDSNQYTEFVNSLGCRYTRYCLSKVRMMRTDGNDSMHGLRWERCGMEQDPGYDAVIIENNCIWYNGHFDVQYFANGETTIFRNNNANVRYVADCYLELTYEASTNVRAILCDAPSINRGLYFIGSIRTLNQPVLLKKAYQVKSLDRQNFSDATNSPYFEKRSFILKPIVDGQMDITDLMVDIQRWGGCLVQIMYSSTNNIGNHFYSDIIAIGPSGSFNPNASITLVARVLAKNNTGHGPATYSYIGTNYQVRMENVNFTAANGSVASVTVIPLGATWGLTPDNNLING